MIMKEDYKKMINLKFRDRITPSDINLCKEMHDKYCGQLKKVICWSCPSSIREAIWDLQNYIEKNPLKDESQDIREQGPTEAGEDSESVPRRNKSRKRSDNDEE